MAAAEEWQDWGAPLLGLAVGLHQPSVVTEQSQCTFQLV
jgi:hypothetical protein